VARRYTGPYARPSTYPVPYATAAVWGTGIDPIHAFYGEGPPVRVLGRAGAMGQSPVGTSSAQNREYQNPANSSGIDPPEEVTWGYPALDYTVDSFGSGANTSPSDTAPAVTQDMDGRPDWAQDTPQESVRTKSRMPSWGTSGELFRGRMMGAYQRVLRGSLSYAETVASRDPSAQMPNETVSEGWINKATSFTAYAEPSDPAQYEVQTSMRQRFGTRDNNRAVMRCTDDPRSRIASRVEPMVEKVYSEGQRNYDMFPFQAEEIERPFRYRTAGLGPAGWMIVNEYGAVTAVQRVPPPDPAMGVTEVGADDFGNRYAGDYGYTTEDSMYYA
jgi:hypothetical protein